MAVDARGRGEYLAAAIENEGAMMSEELAPPKVVHLADEETGDTIGMQIFVEMEIDGRIYALVTPEAPVVTVLRLERDGEDEEIYDLPPEEFGALQSDINAALKPYSVCVDVVGDEYMLVGEAPDSLYEDCGELTLDEDEDYLILAEIDNGEAVYLVCQPPPEVIPVELGDNDVPRLLTDDEMEALHDTFQSVLQEAEEAE